MRQKTLPTLLACGLAAVLCSTPALAGDNCNCHSGASAKPRIIYASQGVSKSTVKHSAKKRTAAKPGHVVSVKHSKRAPSYHAKHVKPVKVVWAKNSKMNCLDFKRTGDLACACDEHGIGTRVSAPRVALKSAEWERLK